VDERNESRTTTRKPIDAIDMLTPFFCVLMPRTLAESGYFAKQKVNIASSSSLISWQ